MRRLVNGLTKEIGTVLDGWKAVVATRDGAARAQSGAALRHCGVMIKHLERAHANGDELLGRLVARNHLETWFTCLYLHYGKGEAYDALRSSWKAGVVAQHNGAVEHDKQLARRRKDAVKRNKKITETNAGIALWNEQNPGGPARVPHELVAVPDVTFIGIDWSAIVNQQDAVAPVALPMQQMVDRLADLVQGTDDEATFGVAYQMVYRGLSGLGAHPTAWVLDRYVESRWGRDIIGSVAGSPTMTSLAQANLDSALLLLAAAGARILGHYGDVTPVCDKVLGIYQDVPVDDSTPNR